MSDGRWTRCGPCTRPASHSLLAILAFALSLLASTDSCKVVIVSPTTGSARQEGSTFEVSYRIRSSSNAPCQPTAAVHLRIDGISVQSHAANSDTLLPVALTVPALACCEHVIEVCVNGLPEPCARSSVAISRALLQPWSPSVSGHAASSLVAHSEQLADALSHLLLPHEPLLDMSCDKYLLSHRGTRPSQSGNALTLSYDYSRRPLSQFSHCVDECIFFPHSLSPAPAPSSSLMRRFKPLTLLPLSHTPLSVDGSPVSEVLSPWSARTANVLSVSSRAWNSQQLQEAVQLIADSTMHRAIIIWPGEPTHIKQRFAEHSLHVHDAATLFMATALPSAGRILVFDRGFSTLSQSSHPDLQFRGPIVTDTARSSPHFLSPGQPVEPVGVYVMFWPPSVPGVVSVELDGTLLAEIPFESQNDDSFEASVPLPEALATGTHVVVLRAAARSNVIAQSSASIVIANEPVSKWPNSIPAPEVQHQVALQPPPQTIPAHLLPEFTMNHTVDVDYMYPPPPLSFLPRLHLLHSNICRPQTRVMILLFQVFLGRRDFESPALLLRLWNSGQYRLCYETAFLLL
jgi:hypothetical protein